MSAPPVPRALAICGPTASGKSAIAVAVAREIGGEIVNADSRQVYRDLTIGTGVPSPELLAAVPHHLFRFVDPCERYSAGAYARDAAAAIAEIEARSKIPIVVGGTGLYIEALGGTMPMDRLSADDAIRTRVRLEAALHPHDVLHEWLRVIARDEARRVPEKDRYRTLRALEAALAGRSAAGADARRRAAPSVALRPIVVDVGPRVLDERIAARSRAMFDEGIVEEALAVRARCPHAPALTGLGYSEALAWSRGEMTRAEAIASTSRRTVRYAKRQRTWFRRMGTAARIDASDARAATAAIVALAREIFAPA